MLLALPSPHAIIAAGARRRDGAIVGSTSSEAACATTDSMALFPLVTVIAIVCIKAFCLVVLALYIYDR